MGSEELGQNAQISADNGANSAKRNSPMTQPPLDELRAEMDRIKRNRDMWRSQCEQQAGNLREARDDVRIWKGEAANRSEAMIQLNLDRASMSVDLMQAKEEIERLRGALEPFARTDVIEPNGLIFGLERYHFERARAALAGGEA